jgi:acyl-coenzyme A thioesterase PaaI-like protein
LRPATAAAVRVRVRGAAEAITRSVFDGHLAALLDDLAGVMATSTPRIVVEAIEHARRLNLMSSPRGDNRSTKQRARAAEPGRRDKVQSPDGQSRKKVYVKVGEGDNAEEIAGQLIEKLFQES